MEARPTQPTPSSDPGNLVTGIFVLRSGNPGDVPAPSPAALCSDSSQQKPSSSVYSHLIGRLPYYMSVVYKYSTYTETNFSCSLNTTLVSFASYHSLLHTGDPCVKHFSLWPASERNTSPSAAQLFVAHTKPNPSVRGQTQSGAHLPLLPHCTVGSSPPPLNAAAASSPSSSLICPVQWPAPTYSLSTATCLFQDTFQ